MQEYHIDGISERDFAHIMKESGHEHLPNYRLDGSIGTTFYHGNDSFYADYSPKEERITLSKARVLTAKHEDYLAIAEKIRGLRLSSPLDAEQSMHIEDHAMNSLEYAAFLAAASHVAEITKDAGNKFYVRMRHTDGVAQMSRCPSKKKITLECHAHELPKIEGLKRIIEESRMVM